jgi:hypothetical protein
MSEDDAVDVLAAAAVCLRLSSLAGLVYPPGTPRDEATLREIEERVEALVVLIYRSESSVAEAVQVLNDGNDEQRSN